MNLLTAERKRAERVYNYIVAYKLSHDGNSPSYRQIMDTCQLTSTSQVSYTIDALRQEGRIRILTEENRSACCIAVVGGRWGMA